MRLIELTITFICVGLLIGYISADYYNSAWMDYYYIWDKAKDVLLILCLAQEFFPKIKRILWSLAGFFLCRLTWQIFAIDDYATANRPSIIFLLFILEIGVMVYIVLQSKIETGFTEYRRKFITGLKPLIKRWQSLK